MQLLQKKRFLIIAAIILIGASIFLQKQSADLPSNPINTLDIEKSATDKGTTKLSFTCNKGKTVFDVLQSESSELTFDETEFGKLVTSINNKMQGGGKYWLYTVSGKEASVSADSYVCEGGEAIVWELK